MTPAEFSISPFRLAAAIAAAAGMYRILIKCGTRGFWAFVPGMRYYKLGQCCGRERDGFASAVLDFVITVLSILYFFFQRDTEDKKVVIVSILALVLFTMFVVYEIRVYLGLCRTFDRSRLWTVPWVLAEWLPALIWGFSDKFQPVGIKEAGKDEESLAGMVPAQILGTERLLTGPAEASENGLTVRLREKTVRDFRKKRYLLKDISFSIPNGSLVMLLGGSGSGKTTLVNAVTGYEKADATVLLNGVDVYKNYDQMKYRIGFAPQQELIRLNDTVVRTLNDAASLRLPADMPRNESRKRVDEVMDTLGLTAGKNGLVAKKSGGQKKRISIGMELISAPELFILDEPDSGLDGVIARELFEKLRSVADRGNIVMAITHTPDRVIDLFDKVIVLARDSGRVGRLAFYGTPDEARAFFGKDSMEQIIMAVNRVQEGGEGRADEFIAAYADLAAGEAEDADTAAESEADGAAEADEDAAEAGDAAGEVQDES